MTQPEGFIIPNRNNHVCELSKAIYGFKQAPRAWYEHFRYVLLQYNFIQSQSDLSLFILHTKIEVAYILIYVDDIIITGSSTPLLDRIIHHIQFVFALKDLGPLHYFLGIQTIRDQHGLHLSQSTYVHDLFMGLNMTHLKPTSTPMTVGHQLSLHDGSSMADPACTATP